MNGYKGYMYRDTDRKVVSPLGEPIADIHPIPFRTAFGSTRTSKAWRADGYKTIGEAVRDLADQHRALTGADDGELTIPAGEARTIIIGTVKNLHIKQNELGIQLTGETRERIEEAVNGADTLTLKRVLKEWIPQSFPGRGRWHSAVDARLVTRREAEPGRRAMASGGLYCEAGQVRRERCGRAGTADERGDLP